MAENQELQVREKREVDTSREATKPTRAFVPSADIYESENALTVVLARIIHDGSGIPAIVLA